MSAAITAETTAVELAAELRALADRVERATSWASLRESLDSLTPTLRPIRSRVVRHTRAPKAAPAEQAAPAPKPEPAKVAPEPKPEPKTAEPTKPVAAPTPPAPASARCPGTLRVVVVGLLLSLWWSAGDSCRHARRVARWRWGQVTNDVRWATRKVANRVVYRSHRLATRIGAAFSRVTSKIGRRP